MEHCNINSCKEKIKRVFENTVVSVEQERERGENEMNVCGRCGTHPVLDLSSGGVFDSRARQVMRDDGVGHGGHVRGERGGRGAGGIGLSVALGASSTSRDVTDKGGGRPPSPAPAGAETWVIASPIPPPAK